MKKRLRQICTNKHIIQVCPKRSLKGFETHTENEFNERKISSLKNVEQIILVLLPCMAFFLIMEDILG